MRPTTRMILSFLPAVLLLGACDDDDGGTDPGGPFDVTVQGDATFQGAHGGQDIAVALLDDGGSVLATMSGTVSANDDPAFSVTFSDAATAGESYAVDYWIDSNFGGGTEGTCDPPANDHQWHLEFGPVQDDVVLADTHRPAETTEVCSSF